MRILKSLIGVVREMGIQLQHRIKSILKHSNSSLGRIGTVKNTHEILKKHSHSKNVFTVRRYEDKHRRAAVEQWIAKNQNGNDE